MIKNLITEKDLQIWEIEANNLIEKGRLSEKNQSLSSHSLPKLLGEFLKQLVLNKRMERLQNATKATTTTRSQ